MLTDMQIPIVPVSDGTTQRLIANIQENTVANKDYATGEQFILNGVLYKVTKTGSPAITQGATIDIANDCEVSDTITQQIESIESLFSPSAYSTTGLTYTNCTYVLGGYIKIGKIVIVNLRVAPIGTTGVSVTGFPKYTNFSQSNKVLTVSTAYNVTDGTSPSISYIKPSGELNIITTTTGKEYAVNFVYLCN